MLTDDDITRLSLRYGLAQKAMDQVAHIMREVYEAGKQAKSVCGCTDTKRLNALEQQAIEFPLLRHGKWFVSRLDWKKSGCAYKTFNILREALDYDSEQLEKKRET